MQYLTFRLGNEQYAVDILSVQGILGRSAVTPIPNGPRHVKGVMNLRGTIIPVIDLRAKLNMAGIDSTETSVIVVATIGAKAVGLVVDGVSDVVNIERDAIHEVRDIGIGGDEHAIHGVARAGDALVVVLDLDQALGGAAAALVA